MTWNILHVTIKTCAFHSTRSQTQTFERIWFVALSIFLLVTSCSHSFVVSNWRYPFSLLLGFNLWNIAILWFLSFWPRRSLHLLCNHANGQPLSQGSLLPTVGQLYQLCWPVSSCVTFFVTVHWKFQIILKFSMENTLNSRKTGKILSS